MSKRHSINFSLDEDLNEALDQAREKILVNRTARFQRYPYMSKTALIAIAVRLLLQSLKDGESIVDFPEAIQFGSRQILPKGGCLVAPLITVELYRELGECFRPLSKDECHKFNLDALHAQVGRTVSVRGLVFTGDEPDGLDCEMLHAVTHRNGTTARLGDSESEVHVYDLEPIGSFEEKW